MEQTDALITGFCLPFVYALVLLILVKLMKMMISMVMLFNCECLQISSRGAED